MTTEIIKTDQKPESEFFIIKSIRKAQDICMEKLKDYNEKYVRNPKEMFKDYNEKYVRNFIEKGKDFGTGLKKDTLKVIDLAAEKGKKIIPGTPVQTAKDKIGSGFKTVTDKINLPSKQDIEKLTGAVEALNSKVDSLNKN